MMKFFMKMFLVHMRIWEMGEGLQDLKDKLPWKKIADAKLIELHLSNDQLFARRLKGLAQGFEAH